jgi:hypothetical protein
MNLTGKAKEEFEKWLIIGQQDYDFLYLGNCGECNGFVDFNSIPTSMQYGVYVDFFDSVGIIIEIELKFKPPYPFGINYTNNGVKYFALGIQNKFETRREARTAAINKANEIFNERN